MQYLSALSLLLCFTYMHNKMFNKVLAWLNYQVLYTFTLHTLFELLNKYLSEGQPGNQEQCWQFPSQHYIMSLTNDHEVLLVAMTVYWWISVCTWCISHNGMEWPAELGRSQVNLMLARHRPISTVSPSKENTFVPDNSKFSDIWMNGPKIPYTRLSPPTYCQCLCHAFTCSIHPKSTF